MGRRDVVIVGAGLAGLRCALEVRARGLEPLVLEASAGVGGRIRTDRHEGFLLDRGFQVYLTAYPEAGGVLDLAGLDLRPFDAGALVRDKSGFRRFSDPLRHPVAGLRSVVAGPGTLEDRVRLGRRRLGAAVRGLRGPSEKPESSTRAALDEEGFSDEVVRAFFRPFFGGVFLDPSLSTSRRFFDFLFDMFSRGRAALPNGGMEAIPAQLAARLPAGVVRTGARVVAVEPDAVTLATGERIEARAVVVATGLAEAEWLTGLTDGRPTHDATVVYFAAARSPVDARLLVLNGTGRGPVNHVCFPSDVAPGYAPPGQTLVSATVLSAPAEGGLEAGVRTQLAEWFGPEVRGWRHLRSYRIANALPSQPPGSLAEPPRVRLPSGVYVCGDHREHASIEGALISGRRAADAVTTALRVAA